MISDVIVTSLNLSEPETLSWRGREVRTGIFKHPVNVRARALRLGLEGDFVADLRVHGGADKAVYAYPAEHYPFWCAEYPALELDWGAFGENLTLTGLLEPDVQVGDRFQIGDAVLEVTQSRIPCFKLGRKMGPAGFVRRFLASGRCGWYLRVVTEGALGAGDTVRRVAGERSGLTISDLNAVLRGDVFDPVRLSAFARISALPEHLRNELAARGRDAARQRPADGLTDQEAIS